MREINPQDLKLILERHRKWVMSEPDGERADLRYADLRYANLSSADLRYADLRSANLRYADLRYANLSSANLSYADLRYANLRSANLRYANLRSANLSYANFTDIIEDFYKVLNVAKNEVPELYKSILDGKIDGSEYEGECACLVGTIANIKNVHYKSISGIKPDSSRPSERWFLGIKKGDTPSNSEISRLTSEWMEAWMKKENINIPTRTIIWNQ